MYLREIEEKENLFVKRLFAQCFCVVSSVQVCFSVPVFACLTPFSHSLRSGSIPKGSNLCRLTCHSLSSDRPDSGENLRGHDDHGVLPAEQNQALAGPPRRAGTAVRWGLHSVSLSLSLCTHSDPFKLKRWPTHSPKTAGPFFIIIIILSFCHSGRHPRKSPHFTWVKGRKAGRGRQKNVSTNQARLLGRNAAISWREGEFVVSPSTVIAA